MNLNKKLAAIKHFKARLNRPLRFYLDLVCLELCTYSNFYVNCSKYNNVFFYSAEDFNVFEMNNFEISEISETI